MWTAAAAVSVHPAAWLGACESSPATSDRGGKIQLAIAGLRGRGNSWLRMVSHHPGIELRYVCDPDERLARFRLHKLRHLGKRRPAYRQDLRDCLEDPELDLVIIATPDHWHALAAIWSMQAGKHVYVERPLSHLIGQARGIQAAVRKYRRLCQVGFQLRSAPAIVQAMDYLHDGGIGRVRSAEAVCHVRRQAVPRSDAAWPYSRDSHAARLWLGPMGTSVASPQHYGWRWDPLLGHGALGCYALDQLDLCRWGLRRSLPPDQTWAYQVEANPDGSSRGVLVGAHFEYESSFAHCQVLSTFHGEPKSRRRGVLFRGTDGYLIIPSHRTATAFDMTGRVTRHFRGRGDSELHLQNLLNCVIDQSPHSLNCNTHEGEQSSLLCQLANLSLAHTEPVDESSLIPRDSQHKLSAASLQSGPLQHRQLLEAMERLQREIAPPQAAPRSLALGPALRVGVGAGTVETSTGERIACDLQAGPSPFVVPDASDV